MNSLPPRPTGSASEPTVALDRSERDHLIASYSRVVSSVGSKSEAREVALAKGNLAALLWARYQDGVEPTDLSSAVDLSRQAAAESVLTPDERGRLLVNLGVLLLESKDSAGALEATSEAVSVWRDAAERHNKFVVDLAAALIAHAAALTDVGLIAQAVDASSEAVEIEREAVRIDARETYNLATALDNLASRLSAAGMASDAVDAATESVELFRRLAGENQSQAQAGLAASLNNLGVLLRSSGRTEETHHVAEESLQIYRRLADDHPTDHLSHLATASYNSARPTTAVSSGRLGIKTIGGTSAPALDLDTTDNVLVRRLAEGDNAALEALYDRHVRSAFALARRITGDPVSAEEVVQEVFLALWKDSTKFDPSRSGFPSWLLAATHHKAVDAVRREQTVRSRRASLADEADDYVAASAALPPVEDAAWAGLRGERVRKALSSLPTPQREALVLAYYAGYTQAEIAERTGTPVRTVERRIRAGMRKLARLLDEVPDNPVGGSPARH